MSLAITINGLGQEGLYGKNVCYPFFNEDEIEKEASNGYNIIYLTPAISPKTGKIHVKIGGTKKSIDDRYHSGNTNIKRMILKWETTLWDKPIINYLKKREKNNIGFHWVDPKESLWGSHCRESFEIDNDEEGLKNFINIINEKIGYDGQHQSFNREPFKDVLETVDEVIHDDEKYVILDFCARYCKTSFTCELVRRNADKCRIAIMCSYVGTVRRSYQDDELGPNERYKTIKFVNPDDYENKKDARLDMKAWLDADPKNQIIYYIAMTGSNNDEEENASTFTRRTKALLAFRKLPSFCFVEEADFGSHCFKQAKKIRALIDKMNCKKFYGMTGTNADRIFKIFPSENFKIYNRDYFIHVLQRENAVKIIYNVLNNSIMAKFCGGNVMENWSDMLKLNEDGTLKEEAYLKKLFRFIFEQDFNDDGLSNEFIRELKKKAKGLLDDRFATEIFTVPEKKVHAALKDLLERTLGTNRYLIRIINGDETTNSDGEQMARDAIKDANGRKVIFICGNMCTRSFSVGMIKNVILMFNEGCYATTSQKIARALTPLAGAEYAHIIDFRMTYNGYKFESHFESYLGELAALAIQRRFGDSANEAEYITTMLSSGKIIFDEYFAEGFIPFKELSKDEIMAMARGARNFNEKKALLVLEQNFNTGKIAIPKICKLENTGVSFNEQMGNENVKGDQDRKMKIHGSAVNDDNANEDDDETSASNELTPYEMIMRHMQFFTSKSNIFISDQHKYEKDKLYNEFMNMSTERKKAYEDRFGIDMNTMKDIVKAWYDDGVDIDTFLKYKELSDEEKDVSMIKATMTENEKQIVWNYLKFDSLDKNRSICLKFLGSPWYYFELLNKGYSKDLIYIIEDIKSKCLFNSCGIPKDHIFYIDFNEENQKFDKKLSKMNSIQYLFDNFFKSNFDNMKFDHTIMNPPWGTTQSTTLGQNILKEALKHSVEVTCLYGDNELFNLKNKKRMEQFKHCDYVKILKNSNDSFAIGSRHGSIIAHFDTRKTFDKVKIEDDRELGWEGIYRYDDPKIHDICEHPKKAVEFFNSTMKIYHELFKSSLEGGMTNFSNDQFEYYENKCKGKSCFKGKNNTHTNIEAVKSPYKFILNRTSYEHDQDPYYDYVKNEGGCTWTCKTQTIKDNMYYWLHDCPLVYLWRKLLLGCATAACFAYGNIPTVDFTRKDFRQYVDSLCDNFNKKYTIEDIRKILNNEK